MAKKDESPYSVRIQKEKLKQATELGIDVAETFRDALDKKIRSYQKNCPECGRPRQSK